jgi:hypothetical protein
MSLTHINQIEGLVSQIHEHLKNIHPETGKQDHRQIEAIKGLSKWEVEKLYKLRKSFE